MYVYVQSSHGERIGYDTLRARGSAQTGTNLSIALYVVPIISREILRASSRLRLFGCARRYGNNELYT